MLHFVALSTSRGTVFEAVMQEVLQKKIDARCIGLITTKFENGCREKALNAGVPLVIVERKKGEAREDFDKRVHGAILDLDARDREQYGVTISKIGERPLIACMGWMLLISPWLVNTWRNRIISVHPSLLPKHMGLHGLEDALSSKETETGMTIHIVDEGMDTGRYLVQKSCSILPDDTIETLKVREQNLEKEWYPKALAMIKNGEILLEL